jgi:hypothetical protein
MAMRPFIRYSLVGMLAIALGACGVVPATEAPTATPVPTQPAQPTVAARPTATRSPTVAPQPTAVTPPPTAVAAEPTAATSDPGISEPEVVVSAFLTRFSGGGDRSIDPAAYLSNNLRAQIRPDYPLNYILGVQNMYSGFQVLGADGAAGTVRVRALLSYSQAKQWTFVLINEDGQWRIDQIITPQGPTTPAPTPMPNPQPAGGAIFYLDPDGVSVQKINADGSAQELVYSDMSQSLGGPITYMGPVPGNQLQMLIIGAEQHYITASGGVSVDLGNFASTPRWSPDGWRVAGASVSPSGAPGAITIFDLRERKSSELPVAGTPDWYPDGQRLVYAACDAEADSPGCNVYSYDLASGTSARLSQLVSTAEDRWWVQEAHVLPSGNEIIFYGNHTSQVGASGNGLQWWWMPIDGGEAQLFSQNFGNGVNSYLTDPRGGLIAYSTRAHWSACASVGDIVVRDTSVAGDSARGEHPQLPGSDFERDTFAATLGLSWDPSGSGRLAFGSQAYTCTDQNRQMQTPGVYIWESGNPSAAPRKLADGSFPVWMP